MIKKRNILYLILVSLVSFLLGACHQNPIESVIASKNDGSFDASIVVSASEHHEPDATQNTNYAGTFYSTDDSVEFRLSIDETISDVDMPVVEVEPHFLTEEDVRRVAYALFGDAEFYESEPRLSPTFSQSDIQEKINRWVQYTNVDALKVLYGDQDGNTSGKAENIKKFIKEYTALFEEASIDNPHIPCQWIFKKDSYYRYPSKEADTMDTSSENDIISAQVKVDDVRYTYRAAKRKMDDYKLNLISVYLEDGISPNNIDERIFRAELCRTKKPTDAQIQEVKEIAETTLRQMELGEWLVDECYVEVTFYGDIAEYVICVNAVPVFNGTPAIRRPQLNNLNSEKVYASNYYLTDARFQFSASGDLIDFRMYSPVDVVDIVNDNVAVMSIDDLVEKAKSHLELSDKYEYGMDAETINNYARNGRELDCTVTICELNYNLTRVKVPNTDDSYYYVPGITLKGNVEYTDPSTGEVYFENNGVTLVAVNGVDGTIISTTNE